MDLYFYYRPCFIDLINNEEKIASEIKLIGITKDENLTFDLHVKYIGQKLFAFKKNILSYSP
jgi:hypothetical protein